MTDLNLFGFIELPLHLMILYCF